MKKRKCIAIIIMIVAIGVFLYASYQLYLIFSEYDEGVQEYDVLREHVQMIEEEEVLQEEESKENLTPSEYIPCPISVDFQNLKEINSDIVGWLYIEAIPKISYPIVQGKDNTYYLKHTVEGVRNSSASIFMDYRNNSDYTDSNTLIYGHNMKNQSMFGLLKYMREPDIFAKSPYIWIVTEDKEICYEIFSVRNVPESDVVYRIRREDTEDFKTLLESFQNASEIENKMEFNGTEQIITLSTCTSNDTVRWIVQAVRKEF